MIVILDNIRSALNVGSIMRTCDALGIKKVYFCGITPEINNPKVHKTALGAENNIVATYFKTTTEGVLAAKKAKKIIVSLELTNDAVPISSIAFQTEIALIIRNESVA